MEIGLEVDTEFGGRRKSEQDGLEIHGQAFKRIQL